MSIRIFTTSPHLLLSGYGTISGVDPDYARYREIIGKKAREDLQGFISPEKMNILKGGKVVQLPKYVVQIPRFARRVPGGTPNQPGSGAGSGSGGQGSQGNNGGIGGIGFGPGKPGQGIGKIGKNGMPGGKGQGGPGETGEGDGAGEGAGANQEEIWGPPITRSEIARIFDEDKYVLPNLKDIGNETIIRNDIKWTTLSRTGNKLHPRRTLIGGIKEAAIEKGEDATPEDVVLDPKVQRYHSWENDEEPHANAVIIYLIDVSGSMGDKERGIARTANFYLSTIIQHKFGMLNAHLRGQEFSDDNFGDGVEEIFVVHDDGADEVNEHYFYHTNRGGGTKISTGYALIENILEGLGSKIKNKKYPPKEWNVYVYHYTDGDNWMQDDSTVLGIFERMEPKVNEIGIVQIGRSNHSNDSNYGFLKTVKEKYGEDHHKVRGVSVQNGTPEEFKQILDTMLAERKPKGVKVAT